MVDGLDFPVVHFALSIATGRANEDLLSYVVPVNFVPLGMVSSQSQLPQPNARTRSLYRDHAANRTARLSREPSDHLTLQTLTPLQGSRAPGLQPLQRRIPHDARL